MAAGQEGLMEFVMECIWFATKCFLTWVVLLLVFAMVL
ncbi:hypothetical protein SEA_ENCELADUS_99 [Mycobacterium phage Enceladus]|nr:hypothetical protein KNU44_gp098 [Mycobacterium phage CicholasNage]YP_010105501.1 hypothetical protein KNU85_gp099 [Mycobacterium phage DirkDirk]YP_010114797.1 hypothetical protein KNV76_gp097 [Mycobacterium phage OhShagHennessy]AEZ50780.1 hypothetical protein [Mycobacterium phage Fezzik]QDK04104.1 hypothetical protein SEA_AVADAKEDAVRA_102 [Mycobacterium phage AvadaKedavra]QGJ92505.1 hypothetical protein SEA_WYATT2_103 [Mycobacterium phage Wyatt2]QOC56766.1 membrane protein [Mycobacterium 